MFSGLEKSPAFQQQKKSLLTKSERETIARVTTFGLFNQVQPVGYKRVSEVQDYINKSYATLLVTSEDHCSYVHRGLENYKFNFFKKIELNVSSIIKKMINMRNKDDAPLCVLDIGAGNFLLTDTMQSLYGDKIKMYGISATDSFRKDNKIVDEYHVINNAENLSSVFGPSSFDLIVSRNTYVHLKDRAGSVMEAYKTLKPGGILLIDYLPLPGCEMYMHQILSWLQKQAYPVIGECKQKWVVDDGQMLGIESFILQKPMHGNQELIFPVIADGYDDNVRVKYRPHPDIFKSLMPNYPVETFKSSLSCYDNHAYQQEVLSILNEAEKDNSTLYHKYNHLPDLFNDVDYQQSCAKQKCILILAITAKSMTRHEFDILLQNLMEKGEGNKKLKWYVGGLQLLGGSLLYYLSRYGFQGISPESQLQLVSAAATLAIFDRIQEKNIIQNLEKLNIDYDNKKLFDNFLLIHSYKDSMTYTLKFPEIATLAKYSNSHHQPVSLR